MVFANGVLKIGDLGISKLDSKLKTREKNLTRKIDSTPLFIAYD